MATEINEKWFWTRDAGRAYFPPVEILGHRVEFRDADNKLLLFSFVPLECPKWTLDHEQVLQLMLAKKPIWVQTLPVPRV